MRIYDPLRQSLRQFRHAPVFAFAVAGTLALAIAATGAAFAVVKRAFLDPLPYGNADRIVTVQTSVDGRTQSVSIFIAEDLRSSPVFSAVAPVRFGSVTYEAPQAAERLLSQEVTLDYFSVLGVQPALGGMWPAGSLDGAVLTWPTFERVFQSDSGVIGRQVSLDGVQRTISGVMPQSFDAPFGAGVGVLLPLDTRPMLADTARGRRTVMVLALRAPQASFEDAAAFMPVFTDGQKARYPQVHARDRWVIAPLRDELVGPSRTAMRGVGGAVVLLMIIVWANIAGLAAAQSIATRKANAVRAALGASAMRLFKERLADSLVLAAVGTAAGLWMADSLIGVAARYQPQFLPNMRAVAFDRWVVLLGVGLGLATSVITALVPHQSVRQLMSSDVLAGRGTAGNRRMTRLRSGLVVVQVAVAIVLLIAGGLLVRTVRNLANVEIGFDTEYLSTFQVNLPASRYQGTPKHLQFERDVLERLRGLHGVKDATASVGFPAAGAMGARLTILSRPQETSLPELVYLSVSPGFFSFLDLPVLAGRDIAPTDDFPAPRVVVINETMAKMFWPAGDAIGAKVKIGAGAASDREITVVGIVPDVRQNGLVQDIRPTAYGSTLQYSWPRRHFSVKSTRPVADIAADLRATLRAVDPLMPMPTIVPFENQLAQQTARHRLVMISLAVFGVVATVLCGLGLYAVVALSAQFRRREFAIRLALGARSREVLWLVFRQSVVLAAVGGTAGLVVAGLVTRTLEGLLYGVRPTDAMTFGSAGLLVLALAICASMLPALKAGRIDPAETLKSE